LIFVATTAIVLGRVGLAFARLIERRSSGASALGPESEVRLRVLEEEYTLLRQELTELQDRQDFTERALYTTRPAQRACPRTIRGASSATPLTDARNAVLLA
jgi:hypothetical protein